MRRSTTLVVCAALGLVAVVGILVQGKATFSGIRWVPNVTAPTAPPAPFASATPAPHPTAEAVPSSRVFDLSPILWIAIIAAIAVAAFLLTRLLRRVRARRASPLGDVRIADPGTAVAPEPEPAPQPDAPTLQRGLALALATLDEDREPRDAIERAWLGLQNAAEESGVRRRASETPAEFTSRVIGRVDTDDEAVRDLLRLYVRVRFGDDPVTPTDLALARRALERLESSWGHAAGPGRASASPSRWGDGASS